MREIGGGWDFDIPLCVSSDAPFAVGCQVPRADEYKWNYVDQLMAGYHDDFADSLKYRRLRFAFLLLNFF